MPVLLRIRQAATIIFLGAFLSGRAATTDWSTSSPEEVGLSSAPLSDMIDFIRANHIPVHSIQLVRHGRMALDAYFYPYSESTRHDLASATKSVTSTLVGLAIDRGLLPTVKQPVLQRFPDRRAAHDSESKLRITLEDLLTMRAGWDCGFEPNEARLFEMRRSEDWVQFMLDLPMVAEPGERWAYCSGNCHLLSAIISQAAGTNALGFAKRELFNPLGIHDVRWPSDAAGNNHGWGDLQLHPRDMAKLGLLFLRNGEWQARRILSKAWIDAATKSHADKTINHDHYGYFWWVKGDDFPGMFEAVGRGGQRINVWPAKDLVIVTTGGGFEPGDIAPFILKSIQSDTSLPRNEEASIQLEERLRRVTKPPTEKAVEKLPTIAAKISNKQFLLSSNALDISSLNVNFASATEAVVSLIFQRTPISIAVGMDGIERFSTNTLNDLPQAAKAKWLDSKSLVVEWDLVGGINFYEIKLSFSDDGSSLNGSLKERTGLDGVQFTGKIIGQ